MSRRSDSIVACTVCAVPFSIRGEALLIILKTGHLSSVSFTEHDIDTDVHYQEGTMATKRAKSTKVSAKPISTRQVQSVSTEPLDVTTRDTEGRTPLHLAAFFGYRDTVRSMLSHEADVNARDNSERTPGHWSAFKGHVEVIKMLVESGADINARDTEGRTLLRMAIIGRQPAIEELLRVRGAVL